jgi:hypothetical protein
MRAPARHASESVGSVARSPGRGARVVSGTGHAGGARARGPLGEPGGADVSGALPDPAESILGVMKGWGRCANLRGPRGRAFLPAKDNERPDRTRPNENGYSSFPECQLVHACTCVMTVMSIIKSRMHVNGHHEAHVHRTFYKPRHVRHTVTVNGTVSPTSHAHAGSWRHSTWSVDNTDPLGNGGSQTACAALGLCNTSAFLSVMADALGRGGGLMLCVCSAIARKRGCKTLCCLGPVGEMVQYRTFLPSSRPLHTSVE